MANQLIAQNFILKESIPPQYFYDFPLKSLVNTTFYKAFLIKISVIYLRSSLNLRIIFLMPFSISEYGISSLAV